MQRKVGSKWPLGIPIWLCVGILSVAGLAAASAWTDDEKWAVIATAVATALLAVFTAQLYGASVAQVRAAMRPVLVEVKPYAPPLQDLGGRLDRRGRMRYNIHFPDDTWKHDWDARRPFIEISGDGRMRVSLILRNVGQGLALIDDAVRLSHKGAPKLELKAHVRYPRLPPGESTRVNLVSTAGATVPKDGRIQVQVPYTDLSGNFREQAIFTLRRRPTRAWTNVGGLAWHVEDVRYVTHGPLLD